MANDLISPMLGHYIAAVLFDLRDDWRYHELTDPPVDDACAAFREAIEATCLCCLSPDAPPTEREVRQQLARLGEMCVGDLAPFRPAIVKAGGVFLQFERVG
jgi:hypothetical protein